MQYQRSLTQREKIELKLECLRIAKEKPSCVKTDFEVAQEIYEWATKGEESDKVVITRDNVARIVAQANNNEEFR